MLIGSEPEVSCCYHHHHHHYYYYPYPILLPSILTCFGYLTLFNCLGAIVPVVHLLSCVQLFVTPWTAAQQSLTISLNLPKFKSIELDAIVLLNTRETQGLLIQEVKRIWLLAKLLPSRDLLEVRE